MWTTFSVYPKYLVPHQHTVVLTCPFIGQLMQSAQVGFPAVCYKNKRVNDIEKVE